MSICEDCCISNFLKCPVLKIKSLNISYFDHSLVKSNIDNILDSYLEALRAFKCKESIRISLKVKLDNQIVFDEGDLMSNIERYCVNKEEKIN